MSDKPNKKAIMVDGQRILVVGGNSPFLEGISDLLQLSGYDVQRTSGWAENGNGVFGDAPPSLALVDLSSPVLDAYQMSERMHNRPNWTDVPILFISLNEDDRIRDLQRDNRNSNGHRLQFYAHSLLGMNGLLEVVKTSLT